MRVTITIGRQGLVGVAETLLLLQLAQSQYTCIHVHLLCC